VDLLREVGLAHGQRLAEGARLAEQHGQVVPEVGDRLARPRSTGVAGDASGRRPDLDVVGEGAEPESLAGVLTTDRSDGPESLSQIEQVRIIGAAIGRRIQFQELSPDEFRRETAETWPRPVVDMLLAAWEATMGRPAFVTSTVLDVVGSPPRTFAQWATDHARAFRAEKETEASS
jgi:hypothetical protein